MPLQLFPLSRHNLFWHKRQKARRLVRVQAPDPPQALALLPEPAVRLGPVRQVQALLQVQVQVLPVQVQVLPVLLQQALRAQLVLPLLP
ncbi:hypothetical protein [Rhodoferax sp. OV413]|uniref:hypothetical protein n=1 Tax=Rhodoferax sp. OV413 TaxID=1855285 RepID=UPI0025E0CF59|nr:hypothetical protein [Rhodoferax sp. OV413]